MFTVPLRPFPVDLILGLRLFLQWSNVVDARTCYFPNGTAFPRQKPCNLDAEESPCCIGRPACQSNGLCGPYNGGSAGRGTCTDPTWKSDLCPKACLVNEYQGPGARNFSNDRQKVWNCSSNTAGKAGFFCCDPFDQDTAGNCCPGKGNINIFSIGKDGVQVQSLPPSTLSSTRSSTSSSSVSTTSTTGIGAPRTAITAVTSTSSPSSSSGSSLSSGAKVGLGVGVPLGVIAIAAVAAAAFFLRRSRRTLESPMIQDHGHQVTVTSTYGNRESYPSPSPQEEQSLGTNTTHELPVRERHELPVGERHELPVGERHELPVGERQQLPENTLHDLPNAQAK